MTTAELDFPHPSFPNEGQAVLELEGLRRVLPVNWQEEQLSFELMID